MEKQKRSYYLPSKLLGSFDQEAQKRGYVREKIVAAAILDFMDSDPNTRSKMFERLDAFLKSKKG